ncbi:hypothetical protein J6A31_09150 [bacterium]|nr:hypothetical protein [bacterium]
MTLTDIIERINTLLKTPYDYMRYHFNDYGPSVILSYSKLSHLVLTFPFNEPTSKINRVVIQPGGDIQLINKYRDRIYRNISAVVCDDVLMNEMEIEFSREELKQFLKIARYQIKQYVKDIMSIDPDVSPTDELINKRCMAEMKLPFLIKNEMKILDMLVPERCEELPLVQPKNIDNPFRTANNPFAETPVENTVLNIPLPTPAFTENPFANVPATPKTAATSAANSENSTLDELDKLINKHIKEINNNDSSTDNRQE